MEAYAAVELHVRGLATTRMVYVEKTDINETEKQNATTKKKTTATTSMRPSTVHLH